MAILTDKDKLAQYRYIVSEFYIIIDGKNIKIPTERMSNFKIEHNFEEAVFPIFKISLVLEASIYYKIIKNKDKVKFKMRVQSYYLKDGGQEKSLMKDIINDIFTVFLDDNNEDYQEELKKEAKTDKDVDVLHKTKNEIELFLFKTSIINGLRTSINDVITSCDMSTAVVYLLKKAGAKNVLMSPFQNTTSYKYLVLPPLSIDDQLKYLNNNFGFHKKGTLIYFGLFHSYILDYSPECTAYMKKEWKETVFYILDKNNGKSYLNGAIMSPGQTKYYYNVKSDGVNIDTPSISTNVISGTEASVIDMQGNNTSSASASVKVNGKNAKQVLFNNTSNKYMGSVYAAQQKANSVIITIMIEHSDIEAFNPNKTFTFIFESSTKNSKYKGSYKIASAIHSFTNKGNDYTINSILTFKKAK